MHCRRARTSAGTTYVVFIEADSLISASFHEVVVVAGRLIDVGPLVDFGALVELQRVLRRRSRRQHLWRFGGLPDVMQNTLDRLWLHRSRMFRSCAVVSGARANASGRLTETRSRSLHGEPSVPKRGRNTLSRKTVTVLSRVLRARGGAGS